MTSRLIVALALLPCIAPVTGCDAEHKKGSASDAVVGSEGSEGSESEGTDSASSATEGETEGGTEGGTEGTGTTSAGTTDGPVDPPPPPPPPTKPAPAEPCDPNTWGGAACTTEDGQPGQSFCILVEGEEVQTPCYGDVEVPCYPGDNLDQGCLGWICAWDGADLYLYEWEEPDCETPLVLRLDDAPLGFDPVSAASFDVSGAGECLGTDWPTLPWLALDRDGDGVISSGRELFGSGTRLASGRAAVHGFEALAEHDLNRDGKITAADPIFAELVLWSDRDGDRKGARAELVPVREVSLVAIDLAFERRPECDARGNCGGERAGVELRGEGGELRRGEIIDVYLACQ